MPSRLSLTVALAFLAVVSALAPMDLTSYVLGAAAGFVAGAGWIYWTATP